MIRVGNKIRGQLGDKIFQDLRRDAHKNIDIVGEAEVAVNRTGNRATHRVRNLTLIERGQQQLERRAEAVHALITLG